MQVLFTFGALPLMIPAWLRGGGAARQDRYGLALGALCGVLGALANLALFYAIRDGKISVVAPLTALSPVVTFVLGAWILKERINRLQLVGVLMALVAIVLLSI